MKFHNRQNIFIFAKSVYFQFSKQFHKYDIKIANGRKVNTIMKVPYCTVYRRPKNTNFSLAFNTAVYFKSMDPEQH